MRGLLVACLVIGLGCRAPLWLGPSEAMPWHPDPALIRALRDTNDLCAGRVLARPSVDWFVVPGDGFDAPSGYAVGYWTSDQRIYIASADTVYHWVLRHELLHASLGTGHPPVFRVCGVMP